MGSIVTIISWDLKLSEKFWSLEESEREREKVIVMAFRNEGGRNNGCSIILLYFIVWIRFLSYTMQIGHSLFLTSPFLNFTINITFSHSSNDQIFSANSDQNFSNDRKYYLVKNILLNIFNLHFNLFIIISIIYRNLLSIIYLYIEIYLSIIYLYIDLILNYNCLKQNKCIF